MRLATKRETPFPQVLDNLRNRLVGIETELETLKAAKAAAEREYESRVAGLFALKFELEQAIETLEKGA